MRNRTVRERVEAIMAERRAAQRVAPEQPLSAKVKTSLPARVVDISSRGAQLELINCLRPNVTCELRLQLPDGEVLVRANVRRCRAWGFGLDEKDQRVLLYRAGVEFEDVAPEIVARIKRTLTARRALMGFIKTQRNSINLS